MNSGDGTGGMLERVLPDSEQAPAAPSEEKVHRAVPFLVCCNFRDPEVGAGFGHATVPAAAVPEAAVDKDGEARVAEDEIRAARDWLMPAPTGDSGCA